MITNYLLFFKKQLLGQSENVNYITGLMYLIGKRVLFLIRLAKVTVDIGTTHYYSTMPV